MTLPTPINWLQERLPAPVAAPTTIEEEKTLMLFHTDAFFDGDNQMASVIEACVFNTAFVKPNIDYEGIIKESDREKVQEFITSPGNYDFRKFAEAYEELEFGQNPNWVWITDTLMNICDKLEFLDQSPSKDVRFWMLVQNYEYKVFNSEGELFGQHYDRRGRCHMALIETTNLANWEPITRENIEISIQGGSVQNFDLPMWIYDLAFEG